MESATGNLAYNRSNCTEDFICLKQFLFYIGDKLWLMVMGPEILFMVGEYLSYESSVMPVCLYEPLPPIDQNYSMDKLTLAQ